MINNILSWTMVAALCAISSISYGDTRNDPMQGDEAKSQQPLLLAGKLSDFLENIKKSVEEANQKKALQDSPPSNSQSVTAAEQSSSSSTLSREDNREIQQRLINLGYNPGPADGMTGDRTRSAIQKYQAANNLPVDGEPSRNLMVHLQSQSSGVRPIDAPTTKQAIPIRTSANNSKSSGQYTPFGIPLYGHFSADLFKEAPIEQPPHQGQKRYQVVPAEPHQAFDTYLVSVSNNGMIYRVLAAGRHNTSRIYGSQSTCIDEGTAIAHAIGIKYGATVNETKNGVRIINKEVRPKLYLKYNWLCMNRQGGMKRGVTFDFYDAKMASDAFKAAQELERSGSRANKEKASGVPDVF